MNIWESKDDISGVSEFFPQFYKSYGLKINTTSFSQVVNLVPSKLLLCGGFMSH